MLATGRVTELHRWPVKSMAGQPVDALNIDERGAAGDRAHALFDEFKGAPRRLTVRQVPRMLLWRAGYDGADVTPQDVPFPELTAPDGRTFDWRDPQLPQALEADLGRPVALRRDLGLMQDLDHSLLVTTQATLDAVSAALDTEIDLRRFRTNVHVVLDAEPYAEEAWEGRELPSATRLSGCCTHASAASSRRAIRTARRSGRSCCAGSRASAGCCSA